MSTPVNPAERTVKDFIDLTMKVYADCLASNTLHSLGKTLEKLKSEPCPVSMMDAEKIEQIAERYAALSNNSTEKNVVRLALEKVKTAYNYEYLKGPAPTSSKRTRKPKHAEQDVSDLLGPVDVKPKAVVPAAVPVKPAPQEIIVRVIIEVAQ